jgi:hypothetical protein
VHSTGDTLLDDTCTLLAYLQNERVRPTPDGAWSGRHVDRLAHYLHDPDPNRFAFLHHVVQRLGWLRTSDSGHLRPDPGPVTAWLRSPTRQQRGLLFEAWRDDPTHNDLFRVPTLHPEDTGAWHNDPLLARQAILHHLKACTPGAWYRLDAFVAAVKRVDPDFQRPDGDYASWYIRDATTNVYLSGFENWDEVEGALIRYLVTRPLTWLGLIDLGVDQAPASVPPPSTFRLKQAGAALLGRVAPSSEPEPGALILRTDFTVSAPPARRYERFQLARVADWVRTEDPFVYRLTPTSLERARRQGIPVARVLEFLSQVTERPVPRPVEMGLTRWDTHGSEARLERVVLLRFSGESWMTRAISSPQIRHLIQEQIGPTAALVRERDCPRLVAALGKMGLLTDVAALEQEGAK